MLVSMQQSKRRLAALWFSISVALAFVIFLQTLFGQYGDLAGEAWEWFFPLVLPTLSLIAGVLVSDKLGRSVEIRLVDRFTFRLTFALSVVYLVMVALSILLQPPVATLVGTPPLDLLQQSSLGLNPMQGIVIAFMGAFFIRQDQSESTDAQGKMVDAAQNVASETEETGASDDEAHHAHDAVNT